MRTKTTTTVSTVLTCLLAGTLLAGCGSGDSGNNQSADDMLEDANAAMRALKSVRVDSTSTAAQGGTVTVRLVTDLEGRCTARTTFSQGGTLDQIRIGGTDYVRPDRAYLENRKPGGLTGEQRLWIKKPADAAQPGDGLSSCTRPFESFGTARKGKATRVAGREAVALTVTDKADEADEANKGGTYTFYVATKGKPHLLKAVYKGAEYDTSTSFADFDEPLDIRPPEPAEVITGEDVTP
ncbi:hypothetical protein ACIQ6R_32575 [Streptomyces sp. NPDC096048]|uniref:hypothetical protein n=1 Tax=Streptomyces sp. NPDC096048 TaxID=3366072 RepID=UPI00380C6B13